MDTIVSNRTRERILNDFSKEYRDRTLSFLGKHFQLSFEDCEDVFQEASITLCLAAAKGALDDLTSSLYTYFIGICKNKAFEKLRTNKKHATVSLDDIFVTGDHSEVIADRADRLLNLVEEDEAPQIGLQLAVQDVVRNLPPPCDKMLWAYYRDELSMKSIASMFNYASENAAKVTKHRCMEKFRKTFEALK